jgi:hypothetical protein
VVDLGTLGKQLHSKVGPADMVGEEPALAGGAGGRGGVGASSPALPRRMRSTRTCGHSCIKRSSRSLAGRIPVRSNSRLKMVDRIGTNDVPLPTLHTG